MTKATMPWRPLDQGDLDRTAALVHKACDAWLASWVAKPFPSRVDAVFKEAGSTLNAWREGSTWAVGPDIHITMPDVFRDLLVRAALDLPHGVPFPGEATAVLPVDVLQKDMTADLLSALTQALAPGAPPPEQADMAKMHAHAIPHVYASLTDRTAEGTCWLEITIAAPWYWQQPLGRSRAPAVTMRPTTRNLALEESRVTLAALLGRCELTAMELAGLAIGDVITSTHAIDAPADIVIMSPRGTHDAVIARGAPGQAGNRMSLFITSIHDEISP